MEITLIVAGLLVASGLGRAVWMGIRFRRVRQRVTLLLPGADTRYREDLKTLMRRYKMRCDVCQGAQDAARRCVLACSRRD